MNVVSIGLGLDRRTVSVNGTPLYMTRREFDLIRVLLERHGRPVHPITCAELIGATSTGEVAANNVRFLRRRVNEKTRSFLPAPLIDVRKGRGLRISMPIECGGRVLGEVKPELAMSPEQRAALDRTKNPRVHPYRVHQPTGAEQRADRLRTQAIVPSRERLVLA